MEDIPKSLESEMSRLTGKKSSKKSKRWILLFVNEQGKVISFRRFKGVTTFSIILLFVSIAVSTVLFFLHERSTLENRLLENGLSLYQQRTKKLQWDKENLTARLIVTESRIEAILSEKEDKATAGGPQITKKSAKVKAESSPVVEPPPVSVSAEPASPPDQPEASVVSEDEVIPPKTIEPPKVTIEAFKLSQMNGQNPFKVKFKIKNTKVGSGPISGYAFVVLKDGDEDRENWVVLPKVEMDSDKPSRYKRGRPFSISRFKTVSFDMTEGIPLRQIKTATVIVFDRAGEVLLEKNFLLNQDLGNG